MRFRLPGIGGECKSCSQRESRNSGILSVHGLHTVAGQVALKAWALALVIVTGDVRQKGKQLLGVPI